VRWPGAARYRCGVRCPSCGADDDKVVDSRAADDGVAIRRRRQCLSCAARFTTFERVEEVPLFVRKRDGSSEPFDRDKLAAGLGSAAKNRLDADAVEAIAAEIEEDLRLGGPEVSAEAVGLAVLERLASADEVAYLRFASVYKGFDDAGDFQREARELTRLQKK